MSSVSHCSERAIWRWSLSPVAHEEYVQIPGSALQQRNGRYQIPRHGGSEVSYLDQMQLYAVDHPRDAEIYTNEKFKSPPYPEFRLRQREARAARMMTVVQTCCPVALEDPRTFPALGTGEAEPHSSGFRAMPLQPEGDLLPAQRLGRLADAHVPESVEEFGKSGWAMSRCGGCGRCLKKL